MSKKSVLTLITIFIFYVVFEALCFTAEMFLDHVKGIRYDPKIDGLKAEIKKDELNIQEAVYNEAERARHPFDPDLGWVFMPNYNSWGEIETNGVRDTKLYPYEKPKNMVRALAFGDSFTFCEGVSNKSTWENFLNQSGNIEVLNFGVAGYGLDQAYLRYLKVGRKYQTDLVFIGYMTENLKRHVNTCRYFYTPPLRYYSKPRFYLDHGKLKLWPSYFKKNEDILKLIKDPDKTIAELGAHDFYYQTRYYARGFFDFLPSVRLFKVLSAVYKEQNVIIRNGAYNPDSEAYKVTVAIFDSFVADVQKSGATPVILVFPNYDDLENQKEGNPKQYRVLLDYFRQRGYRYIDLMDAFDKYRPQYDIKNLINYHYSPLGNLIVADGITDYFLKMHQ